MKVVAAVSFAALLTVSMAAQAQLTLVDESHPSNIQLQDTDEGVVYANAKGMTLYFGADPKPGVSACTNDVQKRSVSNFGDEYGLPNQEHRPTCVSKFPPAEVGDAQPVGDWTVVSRPDGIKQWAYKGRPLYTSIKDYHVGETNGAGAARGGAGRGAAFVPVVLPPEIKIGQVGIARVLTTPLGFTLYTSDQESSGKSACEGTCIKTWRPLLAPALAMAKGDWSPILRADKSRQWAFKGKPLYTFAGDLEPSDVNGNAVSAWKVALAHPVPPAPPAGISTHMTAMGPKYATAKGMTLYMWSCNEFVGQGTGPGLACDDPGDKSNWWTTTCGSEAKCADTWRPLVAPENAKVTGHTWSIVTLPQPWAPVRSASDSDPGLKVWAYRGKPVFTYKYDDFPGMLDGDDIGVFGTLRWTSIAATGSAIGAEQQVVVGDGRKQASR